MERISCKKDKLISFVFIQFIFIFLFLGIAYDLFFVAKMDVEASEMTNITLSNKTEEECIEYILDNDVVIPNEFISHPNLGKIIKDIITKVENNPNEEFFYDYMVSQDFAEDIRATILNSYDSKEISSLFSSKTSSEVTLPNNTLYGEWQDNYPNYNCYSYAIDYIEGDYYLDRGRFPGQMSNGDFSLDLTIAQMAEMVKNDLIAIGYNDVYVTNVLPMILCENEKLICVRKGAEVIPELGPCEGDYIVPKRRYSGFFHTDLDLLLKELGVDTVVMTGLHTHMCVRHTSADAYCLGYNIVVASDATDSFTEEDYVYGIKYLKEVYGATVYTVDELLKQF